MTIDAVYKLGLKCDLDNFAELRYSIRSLVKYFKPLGQIVIVGQNLPNWLDKDKVIHIKQGDPYTANKDANLINKIIRACLVPEVSHYFLNMSDDMYLLKEVGLEITTPLIDNRHIQKLDKADELKRKISRWEMRLKTTIQALKKKNLQTNCYEGHIPYCINKYIYTQILLQYDYGYENGMCGNTLYFNTANEIEKNAGRDVVLKHAQQGEIIFYEDRIKTLQDIESRIQNATYINFTSRSVNDIVHQFLRNTFTEKTVYELY